MAKRILSILLVLCLALSCTACATNKSAKTGTEAQKGDPFDSGWD